MEDSIVFRGEGPCDDFLRSIRKAAFEKGMLKDGAWMAGYASTCFAGEALRWYEGLDDEVQDDWKQLRMALLERFPPVSEQIQTPSSQSSLDTIPGSFIPTAPAAPPAAPPPEWSPSTPWSREIPAAAPPGAAPAAPPPRPPAASPPRPAPPDVSSLTGAFGGLGFGPSRTSRGRLVVMANSAQNGGYIGKTRISGYYEVTKDRDQALRVEYTPNGGKPVDLRLLDSLPESNFDNLGMVWHNAKPKIAARSPDNALCIAIRGPADEGMFSCKTGHSGPAGTTVWSINQDGTVNPIWKVDAQNSLQLQPVVYANKETKRLLFVADWGIWIRRNRPNNYDKAQLVFEPI